MGRGFADIWAVTGLAGAKVAENGSQQKRRRSADGAP